MPNFLYNDTTTIQIRLHNNDFKQFDECKICSTNCEPDNSVALLNDVHDLIANHISSANTISSEAICEVTDQYADVAFAPEFTKRELNFFESESLVQASNLIYAKVLERNYCNDYQKNLQIEVAPNSLTELPTLHSPSPHFIEMFKKIFVFALQSIPYVASEKSLKKFIIEEVRKKIQEEAEAKSDSSAEQNKVDELTMIGCVEHNEVIVKKLFELTTVYAINIFCKNINGLLAGKIKELPPEASAIQELAHSFRAKKDIKKHSDIFKR